MKKFEAYQPQNQEAKLNLRQKGIQSDRLKKNKTWRKNDITNLSPKKKEEWQHLNFEQKE